MVVCRAKLAFCSIALRAFRVMFLLTIVLEVSTLASILPTVKAVVLSLLSIVLWWLFLTSAPLIDVNRDKAKKDKNNIVVGKSKYLFWPSKPQNKSENN